MANSTLDIWNRALSACRAKGRISQEDENSFEREVVQEWYDVVLGTVQEAVPWDCCRMTDRLTLLAERDVNEPWKTGDPEPQFRYKFALPANFLRARQLAHGFPFDITFDLSRDRLALSTDVEHPVLEYSILNRNPVQWSQSQRMATIYGLAAHIAAPLTGSGKFVNRNFELANMYLEESRSNTNNSEDVEYQSPAPWHVVRGAAELQRPPAYLYPAGQLFLHTDTRGKSKSL